MKKVRLKKDWPPFPKGTIFEIKRGCAGDEMLCSPTFGDIMPNGQPANGMIPNTWTKYTRLFDHVGGFSEWFELVDEKCEHLEWIYNRMIEVHGELENVDYMIKFNKIISDLRKP